MLHNVHVFRLPYQAGDSLLWLQNTTSQDDPSLCQPFAKVYHVVDVDSTPNEASGKGFRLSPAISMLSFSTCSQTPVYALTSPLTKTRTQPFAYVPPSPLPDIILSVRPTRYPLPSLNTSPSSYSFRQLVDRINNYFKFTLSEIADRARDPKVTL